MKRDFSQPFTEAENTEVYILAENESSDKFLVIRSFDTDEENDGYYSEEFHHVPHIDLYKDSDLTQQLARLLFSYGFVLNSFREVARETSASYGFTDDTPGETQHQVCIHALITSVDAVPETKKGQESLLVPLPELPGLSDESSTVRVVSLGLRKISLERNLDFGKH